MILRKNKDQRIVFYAENGAGIPANGDPDDYTMEVWLDGVKSTYTNNGTTYVEKVDPDTNGANDAPGLFIFNIPAAATNGDAIVVRPNNSVATLIAIPHSQSFRTGPDWDEVMGATFSSSTDSLQMLRQMMEDARVAVSRN